MNIEYEATFENIDKSYIRKKIKKNGGVLIKREFLQKRIIYELPNNLNNGYVRIRNEGDKNTFTVKKFLGKNIDDQRELEVVVSDFDITKKILKELGLKEKAYQETKRELWKLNGVDIMIDTWPFLETFIEIEGENKIEVKKISAKLGLDWKKAIFAPVTELYKRKYNISKDIINNQTPKIIFNMENPFIISKQQQQSYLGEFYTIDLEDKKINKLGNFKKILKVRGIIFNKKKKIAIINATKLGIHLFPGGSVNKNESIKVALKRECEEEIGINIEIEQEFVQVKEIIRSKREIYHSFYYICHVAHNNIKKREN